MKMLIESPGGIPSVGCVYSIKNIQNDREYIGATSNLRVRIGIHKSSLSRGIHDNDNLQSEYNNYGSDEFRVSIIKTEPRRNRRLILEARQIKRTKFPYNVKGVKIKKSRRKRTPKRQYDFDSISINTTTLIVTDFPRPVLKLIDNYTKMTDRKFNVIIGNGSLLIKRVA